MTSTRDWSSVVCSSDLRIRYGPGYFPLKQRFHGTTSMPARFPMRSRCSRSIVSARRTVFPLKRPWHVRSEERRVGRETRNDRKILTKEGYKKKTSQEVTHPSTTLAQARLTYEF